jgi:hypothetical protein
MDEMVQSMERCNVLVACAKYVTSYYDKIIPRVTSKMVWFPLFAHPRFLTCIFNENPLMKCLLNGYIGKWYPVRVAVRDGAARLGEKLVINPHPGAGWLTNIPEGAVMQDAYCRMLWSHYCAVTDSGHGQNGVLYDIHGGLKFDREQMNRRFPGLLAWVGDRGCAVAKYYEIPATGSLLLAHDNNPDHEELGFQDGVNYVAINPDNVLDKIEEVLAQPERYAEIRKNGMKFIAENHTMAHRQPLVKEIKCRL